MLWANAVEIWERHPIFGAGSSWLIEWQDRTYRPEIYNIFHNGYLEIALDLPTGFEGRPGGAARAIHRIALDTLTPNRAAACRADRSSSEAFKIRTEDPRSVLSPLSTSSKMDVESEHNAAVTSQSIHRSQDAL